MTDWHNFPTALADRCVMCAQCLPHCPTWRLFRLEAESPRGRIAIMRALAAGDIEADGATLQHLDQCLDCRQCEVVCPAEVPYGELHDAANVALGGPRRRKHVGGRMLRWWVTRQPAVRALRWWAGSRLRRAIASMLPGRLRDLDALLPESAHPAPAAGSYGTGEPVMLFTGCIARAFDGETLAAAVRALRLCGFRVEIPARQGCCGALHLHAGDERTAHGLAARNLDAFTGDAPIVTCASGCATTLLDYTRIDDERGARFSARITDIMSFLHGHGARPAEPGSATFMHTPCTLHAVQRASDSPVALLAGAQRLEMRGRCCGAAGEYLLSQPEIAARLRDAVLDGAAGADTLCTSNPGCAMHLRAGLRARGSDTVVRHPVVEWLRHQ